MIKNGISPERLQAVGKGMSHPIADNNTAEGRKKNRRTEFFVTDK
jgi:outer membrane protein OmpA-like peptidoglycan-associated protein